MNNKSGRLSYIEKNFKIEKIKLLTEECFIIETVKNEHAMKYLKKELEKTTEDEVNEAIFSKLNEVVKFDMINTISSCHQNMDNLFELIEYLCYSEHTNNMTMIENLFKKAFSKIYKDFNNKNYNIKNYSAEEANLLMFLMALKNMDLSELNPNIIEELKMNGIIYASKYTRLTIVDEKVLDNEALSKKYDFLVKKYKLNKNISIQMITDIAKNSLYIETKKIIRNREVSVESKPILSIEEAIKTRPGIKDEISEILEIGAKKHIDNFKVRERLVDCLKDSKTHYGLIKNNNLLAMLLLFNEKSEQMLQSGCIGVENVMATEIPKRCIKNALIITDEYMKLSGWNEVEAERVFLESIIGIGLSEAINERTETLCKLSVEALFARREVSNIKNECNERVKEITEKSNKQELLINEKNKTIEELEREITNLKAKINSMEDKEKKEFSDRAELIRLRELFFSLEKSDNENYKHKDHSEFIINDKLNIAFVGGVDNLRYKVGTLGYLYPR